MKILLYVYLAGACCFLIVAMLSPCVRVNGRRVSGWRALAGRLTIALLWPIAVINWMAR